MPHSSRLDANMLMCPVVWWTSSCLGHLPSATNMLCACAIMGQGNRPNVTLARMAGYGDIHVHARAGPRPAAPRRRLQVHRAPDAGAPALLYWLGLAQVSGKRAATCAKQARLLLARAQGVLQAKRILQLERYPTAGWLARAATILPAAERLYHCISMPCTTGLACATDPASRVLL